MKQWILYIVECKDGSLYTGITTDLDKRIKRHNDGRASKYTRVRRPVKVVYTETFDSESLVKQREAAVKRLSHINKLQLIKK